MAGIIDLAYCNAAYYLESAGVVSSQLVDQTAHGNHLDLAAGTPIYRTINAAEWMDFDNSFYFSGDSPLVPGGSIVFVGCVNLAGSEGSQCVVGTAVRKANSGNYDAIPNDASLAEFLSSTYRIQQLFISASRVPQWLCTSATAAGAAWTNNAPNIATCGISGDPANYSCATGVQTPVTANIASAFAAMSVGGDLRLGMLNSSHPVSPFAGGRFNAGKRLFFLTENGNTRSDYAAKLAEEMALWGIV